MLDIGTNDVTGSIPTWLGDLVTLTALHLDANAFIGQVPVELGNLTELSDLFLRFNFLHGCLPQLPTPLFRNDLRLLMLPDCEGVEN